MKKVLIITYYWPPAGGPGVQRWLKFAKYLPQYGYEPVMFVPEKAHYPLLDASLQEEVPQDLKVLKYPIKEPYSIARIFSKKDTQSISSGIIPEETQQGLVQKMLLFIRGNFFIPDARKFWVKPAVKYLREYLKENQIEVVITTGPPHSLHLIGQTLKRELGVRWVADFRDPWTSIGYHQKLRLLPAAQKKHLRLEKEVLQQADQVIVTSWATAQEFEQVTQAPVQVITNGYDVVDLPAVTLDTKFSIAHIGSLLSGRNPENLWKALGELVKENPEFDRDLQIKLVGAVGERVLQTIHKEGLATHVEKPGYVPHKEAQLLQRQSQLLLLIEIDSHQTRAIIPGKLYEYMVSGRPILFVGPENSDPQKIIQETNTGKFFNYQDKEGMKMYLRSAYEDYKAGQLRTYPIGLQKFSRKNLTKELAGVLDKLP